MLQRLRGRRRNGERGAALVEFAILAPLLVLLLFGIIEFGYLFAEMNDVRHGVREGSRYAAVDGGADQDITNRVCSAMSVSDKTSISVVIDRQSAGYGDDIGDTASITVTLAVSSLTNAPLISSVVPSQLSSEVEFRLEQDADSWTGDPTTTLTCP